MGGSSNNLKGCIDRISFCHIPGISRCDNRFLNCLALFFWIFLNTSPFEAFNLIVKGLKSLLNKDSLPTTMVCKCVVIVVVVYNSKHSSDFTIHQSRISQVIFLLIHWSLTDILRLITFSFSCPFGKNYWRSWISCMIQKCNEAHTALATL